MNDQLLQTRICTKSVQACISSDGVKTMTQLQMFPHGLYFCHLEETLVSVISFLRQIGKAMWTKDEISLYAVSRLSHTVQWRSLQLRENLVYTYSN